MKIIFTLITVIVLLNPLSSNANNLKDAESPYLQQHSNNPINWYPWNQNSLKLAKGNNKLIFLSIGYSTCHWCHVMNKESFEDEELAKTINKHYISIKVDKEELPHIDTKFQAILSKLTKRRNGWPLNAILTPNLDVVFITTYIPPTFKYGVEGMNTLIPRIAKRYINKDIQLLTQIQEYKQRLKEEVSIVNIEKNNISETFITAMNKRYDSIYKGFDRQPKFPLATHLNLLYDIALLTKDKKLEKELYKTLDAMAYGGIFDHIEGGFYRYSVYADWVTPHFEKMLYTQAELIALYSKAYQHTKKALYKKVINQTISFVHNRFKTDENLFFSASDADSLNQKGQKEEGYYHTFTYDEFIKALKKAKIKNHEELAQYLGIDEFGNFEHSRNNVYIPAPSQKKPKNLKKTLTLLKEIRKKREIPFIDKKIITSWNSLMIKSLYLASKHDKNHLKQAENSLKSLLKRLYMNEELFHQKLDYRFPTQKALFEDYVFLIDLLLTAYQRTYKQEYLSLAQTLYKRTNLNYYIQNQWYLTKDTQFPVSFNDKYYVSPISSHLNNGLTLANLTSDLEVLEKSKKIISQQKNKILHDLDKHPEAVRALLRVQYGDIILKSNKKNLLKNRTRISKIKYPFLLTQTEDTKLFLACDEKSCFSHDKSLKKVIKAIEK